MSACLCVCTHCPLPTACFPLSAARCQRLDACSLMPSNLLDTLVFRCPQPAIHHQLARCPLLTASYQLPLTCWPLPAARCPVPGTWCPVLTIQYPAAPLPNAHCPLPGSRCRVRADQCPLLTVCCPAKQIRSKPQVSRRPAAPLPNNGCLPTARSHTLICVA